MRKAFTLYEAIIVIAVVGIITAIAIPRIDDDRKQEAADQILSHIRYTQHLALMNDIFQPYPINTSVKETQRCKYYYKQRWQIYFTNTGDNLFYEIFSDSPDDGSTSCFDKGVETDFDEIAIDPGTGKYLVGNWSELSSNQYPPREKVNTWLNLTLTFGIKKIVVEPSNYRSSVINANLGDRVRILFDYLGRPYFNEGLAGVDNGTVNPFDAEKKPLRETVKINFCFDTNCNDKFTIAIEPETGYAHLI